MYVVAKNGWRENVVVNNGVSVCTWLLTMVGGCTLLIK